MSVYPTSVKTAFFAGPYANHDTTIYTLIDRPIVLLGLTLGWTPSVYAGYSGPENGLSYRIYDGSTEIIRAQEVKGRMNLTVSQIVIPVPNPGIKINESLGLSIKLIDNGGTISSVSADGITVVYRD